MLTAVFKLNFVLCPTMQRAMVDFWANSWMTVMRGWVPLAGCRCVSPLLCVFQGVRNSVIFGASASIRESLLAPKTLVAKHQAGFDSLTVSQDNAVPFVPNACGWNLMCAQCWPNCWPSVLIGG